MSKGKKRSGARPGRPQPLRGTKASVRRSSLVCRWSTILIAGASAPYLRINYVFFFQAEDGIRAADVTGVQTCALPIFHRTVGVESQGMVAARGHSDSIGQRRRDGGLPKSVV